MSEEPLLKVVDLKKYYPIRKGFFRRTVGYVKAVNGVSFEIPRGKTLGLVGESGCGKSTLGYSITRIEKPSAGHIFFEGRDIASCPGKELSKIRSDIQMVFQDPDTSLDPRMNLAEILSEPLKAGSRLRQDEIPKRIGRLMDDVGLPQKFRDQYPGELSGGERQRIGIARALAMQPKLIVCDEPVSALDVSIQAQILNLLKDLQQEYHLTYLFIAHGLGSVRYISDRVAVMYLGKIVETAETSELFARPKHPYTKALLAAYLAPDPTRRDENRMILQGEIPSPADPPKGCSFHTRCPCPEAVCSLQAPELLGEQHAVACFQCGKIGEL